MRERPHGGRNRRQLRREGAFGPGRGAWIIYQVAAFGHVKDAKVRRLKAARKLRDRLVREGAQDAEIIRYDRDGSSGYWEVVQ